MLETNHFAQYASFLSAEIKSLTVSPTHTHSSLIHSSSRYDYEEVASSDAAAVMDTVRGVIASSPKGTQFGPYTLDFADDFEYTDPIDGSIAKGQGLRFIFTGGHGLIVISSFCLVGQSKRESTSRCSVESVCLLFAQPNLLLSARNLSHLTCDNTRQRYQICSQSVRFHQSRAETVSGHSLWASYFFWNPISQPRSFLCASSSDGSRIIFRLSGTGSSGATIRLYIEQYSDDASKLGMDAQEALAPIIEVGDVLPR